MSQSSSPSTLDLLLDDEGPLQEVKPISAQRGALRKSAALISKFKPTQLRLIVDGTSEAWSEILPDCEPLDLDDSAGDWRLKSDVRRSTLKELRTRNAMKEVLNSVRERPNDSVQRGIERIVSGSGPELLTLSREDLAGLALASEWFEGILETPDLRAIKNALPLAELLAPLRRLDGPHFVGREKELSTLEDYVGVLDARSLYSSLSRIAKGIGDRFVDRPPLFVSGAGGVGKSTLVAHFILEHVGPLGRDLPFSYLDIDRARLDPKQPLTLLLEIMVQLRTQLPDHAGGLQKLDDELRTLLNRTDAAELNKNDEQERLVIDFAEWTRAALPSGMPLLIVLDTFEEAQFLGSSVVDIMWDLLEALQIQIPQARIVVAGRARPDHVRHEPLLLHELDHPAAISLLKRELAIVPTLDEARLRAVVDLAGGSPMALRLAAQIVLREGREGMEKLDPEALDGLFLKISNEKTIAQLYGRILAHIHDERVAKLAYPGLIVRRITPAVIRDVLAEPCRINLLSPAAADDLFDALAREVALVEPDGERAVKHRTDLRRLMLCDLLARVPVETAEEIDRNAVNFYVRESSPSARAEEVYHRLRLNQEPKVLDSRWIAGMDLFLRSALEETSLSGAARVWLCRRLGVSPDKALLTLASQSDWEAYAYGEAQRYLQHSAPQSALKVLGERQARLPASQLYRLDAETQRILGNSNAAKAIAQRGYQSAAEAGNIEVAIDLKLLLASIEETGGDLGAALKCADEAAKLVGTAAPSLITLRILVSRLRILRLLDPSDQLRAELVRTANDLMTPDVLRDLKRRPLLLREAAAEFGADNTALLVAALEVIGIDTYSEENRERAINALSTSSEAGAPLLKRKDRSPNTNWAALLDKVGPRTLASSLASSVDLLGASSAALAAIAELFRPAGLLPGSSTSPPPDAPSSASRGTQPASKKKAKKAAPKKRKRRLK